MLPNTACTRLVGVGAFSDSFPDVKIFRIMSFGPRPPQAGNANHWAAELQNEGAFLRDRSLSLCQMSSSGKSKVI